MDPNSSSTTNGSPDPAAAGGVLRRAGSATVAGAKAAAPVVASGAAHSWSFFQQRVMPVLKRVFGRIGDWLATVGWGKFALVAILLLAAAGIATNVLYDEGPVVVIDRKAPKESAKVDIKVGPDGIRIERPGVAYRSRLHHRRRPRHRVRLASMPARGRARSTSMRTVSGFSRSAMASQCR